MTLKQNETLDVELENALAEPLDDDFEDDYYDDEEEDGDYYDDEDDLDDVAELDETVLETDVETEEETNATDDGADVCDATKEDAPSPVPVVSSVGEIVEQTQKTNAVENWSRERLVSEVEAREEFRARSKELLRALKAAKEASAHWGRETKRLREELEELVSEYARDAEPRPLLDFAEANAATLERQAEPAGVVYASSQDVEISNDWASYRVDEHFRLTDSQFEKLGLEVDATVGELSNLLNDLTSGRKKIKGVGPAFVEKLAEQFDKFWESDAYRRCVKRVEKPVETALEKANNNEKIVETNETQTVESQMVVDDQNAPVSPDEFDAIRQTIDEIDAGIARGVWEGFDEEWFASVREQFYRAPETVTRLQVESLEAVRQGFENWDAV